MDDSPIVTVQEGKLRGKICTDYRGGKYFSFKGIPYAKPPLGELRFKAPQPPELWSGIRDATQEGSPCYQMDFQNQCFGTEDCLFLNVYTPQLFLKDHTPKPVMVWIHGGGFTMGSGNSELFGPDFLITEPVVIVTINYRLGLLGFLSLEDPSLGVPGNAGFKDQVMALKWVQKNISEFYGNPNNVTLFGESAGAVAVHNLMMSPMAKGLFHKAIIQSGSALDGWLRGQRSGPLIAKVLGHETVDENRILHILKDMSVEELHQIQEKIPNKYQQNSLSPVGLVIENEFSESPFLTEDPIDLINSGRFNKIPLMIGYNSREGLYMELLTKSNFAKRKLDLEIFVPWILRCQKGSNKSKQIAQKIKEFYYPQDQLSTGNQDQFYDIETDCGILSTMQYTIKQQIAKSSEPIYFYRMSLDSTLNYFKKMCKISIPGACHGDELGYLFKNLYTPPIRLGSVEDDNIRKFIKLWTTFAKHGDPNPSVKNPIMNVTWKPVEKGQLHYLNIGENLTVGVNPDSRRMQFWEKIFHLSLPVSNLYLVPYGTE